MKFSGHQNCGMEASGRVLCPGEGYQERDATKPTMDPARTLALVAEARIRTNILMMEREADIEAGLEHLTPAAEMKKGTWR